jgi:hypothetical protein
MTLAARFRRSVTLWIGLALALGYWAVAPVLATNMQTEWLRAGMIAYGSALIIASLPAFKRIFLEPAPIGAQQSILGGFLCQIGLVGAAAWLLLWRAADFPVWMIQSDVNAFWIWLIALGNFFALIAIKDTETQPPRTRWGRVLAALIVTVILGYVVIVARPDVRPFVDGLKVYLYDDHAELLGNRPMHATAAPPD